MTTVIINGVREQSYWLKRPDNAPLDEMITIDEYEDHHGLRSVTWFKDVLFQTDSSGPGSISVEVRRTGIEVRSETGRPYRPGYARWLANRLIEAAAIYETAVGGDGTLPGNISMRDAYDQDIADNLRPI